MKRVLLLVFSVILGVTMFAQQKDVTKFLGIPVDGTKAEMIQKLKLKGYIWNTQKECLEGEFNGRDVEISIVTNNNKVYRIMLVDKVSSNESNIKNRFNMLCKQFGSNGKYMPVSGDNTRYYLSDSENIAHELMMQKKQYQAGYFQFPEEKELEAMLTDTVGLIEYLIKNNVTEKEIQELTEYQRNIIAKEYFLEKISNKIVWFTIVEEFYGSYKIVMYYDNGYNQANGEDL